MCGLIAFAGDYDHEIVQELIFAARRRGPDAFGLARLSGEGWRIETKNTPSWPKFWTIDPAGALAAIGHARLATSRGAPQPIQLESMIFAHNGIVHRDRELATSEGFTYPTGNDSEVFGRLIEKHGSHEALKILEDHQGYHPQAWIEAYRSEIRLASYGHPIHLLCTLKAMYACSWAFEGSQRIQQGVTLAWRAA